MIRLTKISISLSFFVSSLFLFGFGNGISTARTDPETLPRDSSAPMETCPVDMNAYWPLDDEQVPPPMEFEDVIGNPPNDGDCSEVQNCPTSVSGKINTAYYFDGNDRIVVPETSSLNFEVTDSFSAEAWIRTSQICQDNKVYVGEYNGSLGASWWLGCGLADPGNPESDNVAIFSLRADTSGQIVLKGATSINDDGWHHVVAVRDSDLDENLLYVDGQLDSSASAGNIYEGSFSGDDQVTIGYFQSGNTPPFQPGYYYNGALDEVAIYKRALSTEEINTHYNSGLGIPYCKDSWAIFLPLASRSGPADEGESSGN